jgi:LacI family transcriptional regulator, galactose operon repressor
MRDVADAAGVAMSSVSRVLSGHPDVSAAMRTRVMAAVEQLEYRPNLLAQSLRSQQTYTVGFLVGDISNPLFAAMVKGAVTALRTEKYAAILTDSEGDPDLDAMHLRLLEQRRVDGLILSPLREDHPATLEALGDVRVPAVLIDRDPMPPLRADRVLSDHQMGMKPALNHLVDLGHRRIAVVVGLPVRATAERKAALTAVFAERDLEPTFLVFETDALSFESGRNGVKTLLDDAEPPTALIVGGNQLLAGALTEIRARGLRIPDDLSIVSTDDTEVTSLHSPPISTVRRDTVETGRAAATLLLQRMREHADEQEGGVDVPIELPPREVTLPTEFVARESCGPPRRG